MKEVYPESGILAVAYERPYGEYSRLLQYTMSYLASGAQVSEFYAIIFSLILRFDPLKKKYSLLLGNFLLMSWCYDRRRCASFGTLFEVQRSNVRVRFWQGLQLLSKKRYRQSRATCSHVLRRLYDTRSQEVQGLWSVDD